MSEKNILIGTVNQNDNHISSWLWKGDLIENSQRAVHIPIANAIIKNHCPLWYKTQPQTSEYQYAQLTLCSLLTYGKECYGSNRTLQLIAFLIECPNPLAIMNDPEINLSSIL